MTEADFQDAVGTWLREHFIHVKHEPVLSDTQREPDFVVHTPFETYAVEVEDSFENLYRGLGQAIGYAAEVDGVPVVVLPATVIEEPEFSYIQRYFDTRFDNRHLRIVTIAP